MAELIQRTDDLNTGREKLNNAILDAEDAKQKSDHAVNVSEQAKQIAQTAENKADNVQKQFNQVVIEGDSSVEAAQARVDADGNTFTTLKERLDTKETQFASRLSDIVKSLSEFPVIHPEVDDTGRIQRLIDSLGAGETGLIPWQEERYKISTIFPKSKTKLIFKQDIEVIGDGSIGIDMRGCLYSTIVFDNTRMYLTDKNQTGLMLRPDSEGRASQLNTFWNIAIDGEHVEGTTSLKIENSWVNNFYNCKFFRAQNGVEFLGEHANANNFYGCEVRGERTHPNSGLAILHDGGGEGNVWFGGAIENYRDGIRVKGGSFTCIGTYVEGFAGGRRIFLEGGNLTFKDCLFLALVEVSGGETLTFEDNKVPYSAEILNINYPLIVYKEDVATRLYTKGNRLHDGAYLTRFGKYNDGTGFKDRSIDNIKENSLEYNTLISGKLTNETDDLVSGEYHRIRWGNTLKEIDICSEFDGNGGYFIPFVDGFYKLSSTVRLKNITGTLGYAELYVNSGGQRILLDRKSITNRDSDNHLVLKGDVIIQIDAKRVVSFEVRVIGASSTYGIYRGNVADRNSYYHIERIK